MLSTKDDTVLPMVYDVYFISFYLKIINNMTILPPIIIRVVGSKFFTESIRFETFELISVLLFVVVFVVVVVVRGSSMPGSTVWVVGIGAY